MRFFWHSTHKTHQNFWHPTPTHVWCENMHTILCSRICKTMWHPVNTTLQHTATARIRFLTSYARHTATHCNTLQHTATHCNTLQHTATHCNTLQHTAIHCNKLPLNASDFVSSYAHLHITHTPTHPTHAHTNTFYTHLHIRHTSTHTPAHQTFCHPTHTWANDRRRHILHT